MQGDMDTFGGKSPANQLQQGAEAERGRTTEQRWDDCKLNSPSPFLLPNDRVRRPIKGAKEKPLLEAVSHEIWLHLSSWINTDKFNEVPSDSRNLSPRLRVTIFPYGKFKARDSFPEDCSSTEPSSRSFIASPKTIFLCIPPRFSYNCLARWFSLTLPFSSSLSGNCLHAHSV